MKLKQIEITTYRFVFDDDEPKQETKFPVLPKIVNTEKTVSKKETVAATVAKPKPATAKDGRRKWTDEEKADIIRRYKAGECAKAIADSLGTTRQSIQNIIHTAGVTEGRTGVNLKKKKPEQQPDADDNEPV